MPGLNNGTYDNFFLQNEIEDQFKSHLDLDRFCTIDDSLESVSGMKVIVHRYYASAGTEKLGIGEGNTKAISVSRKDFEYDIECAQNHFDWYDEEEKKDPMIVYTGTKFMGTDLYNTTNDDIYAEYMKATTHVEASKFDFASITSACAKLNIEELENVEKFAFINCDDEAALRAELQNTLQYVEAFAKTGYIGTAGGVNIYTKRDAQRSKMVIATKQALTKFVKTGIEIEDNRDANHRKNEKYFRKYYVVALTDDTKVVILEKSVAPTSVALNESTLNINAGKKAQLIANALPVDVTDPEITWASSATSYATVDQNGLVTAVAAGSANITATCGSQSATCAVTVANPSISLNKTTTSIVVEANETLTATVSPVGSTVTWESDDESVATVNSSGKVVGVAVGTANITASITVNGDTKTASCAVTITAE